MVRVAVVGGSGYAGAELVRWVCGHPHLTLTHVTSGAEAGTLASDLYPALAPYTSLHFEAPDAARIADVADVAMLAVPHTAALDIAPALLDAGLTVIDLSADFRIRDAETYESWYGVEHSAHQLLGEAIYGLPELDRSRLAGARLVACPGCYPTASVLAALPALRTGLATASHVIIDAKSGVSGAGRSATATTHYCAANESLTAYKVASHRHTPEIEQAYADATGETSRVVFVPHLVPMTRGLLATAYLDVAPGTTAEEVQAVYERFYDDEPFVSVRPLGQMPTTAEVRGTNRAAVGVAVDLRSNTLIGVCAIDNLGKGAAGQAIQCLNAVLGYPETTGLDLVGPVV